MASTPETPISTAQSEIDAYKAKKEAEDKDKLLQGIFEDKADDPNPVPTKVVKGEPVPLTGREQDEKRFEEGTEYYKHLEAMTKTSDNDRYEQRLMESAHGEALADNELIDAKKNDIETKLKADPRFRRLLMIAVALSDLRNKELGEGDILSKHALRLKNKEMKFQELFDWYEGEGMDHDVLEYILDKAFAKNADQQVAEEVGITPEEESEPARAFRLGQEVKVVRTSGDIEEGWKVTNYFIDAFGNSTYEVGNGKSLKQGITEAELTEWQDRENVVPGEPGSEGAALEGESQEEYEARMAGGDEDPTAGEQGGPAIVDELPEAEKDEVEAEKKVSKLELNVGDKVRFKDKEGNVLEGKVLEIIPLHNEDYFVYKIELTNGEVVTVSYAEIIANETQTGTEDSKASLEDIVFPPDGGKPERAKGGGLDFGNYPELYARRKNLLSNADGQARLEAEGERVAESMSNEVWERVQEFIEHNPDASEEQINQATMGFYVQAENSLQREIIDHIDGKKVDGQETKGLLQKGRLRRFGAWMDRHGKALKTGLLIAGGVGLAATGVGVIAAGGAVGLVVGTGTAIGAAKGAAFGGILTRHGSKNSASREVSVESEQAKDVTANLDPQNRETFDAVSAWIISQRNEAANQDNLTNGRKTIVGVGIGAVAGAVAGSLEVTTPTSETQITQVPTPGEAPELISHQIPSGELTGQVLDRLMADSGINLPEVLQANNITGYGESFTLPDGSTNIALIHAVENTLGANFGEIGQTHSFAGADALSDPGIRSIAEAISSSAAGETLTDVTTTIPGSEVNEPLTILGRVSASTTGVGLAKLVADRVRSRTATRRVGAAG